jgi:aspartate kinase
MIVMKFGGTSVGSGPMLDRVAGIVAKAPADRIVVISAMATVTDSILAVLPRAQRDEGVIEPFLSQMRRMHVDALVKAGATGEETLRVSNEIDTLLQRFERLLYGIAYTEELTGKSRDLAVSFGERLSVRVLAGVLRSKGVTAEWVDADEAGMLTDGIFGNATPLMGPVEANLKKSLVSLVRNGTTPVLTGFFGRDASGHVTTFGRGGSDYAASIVAAAVRAERLEVWKDVEGFLTADPRIIKDAVPIDEMNYDEAAELAYVGAKVLHPRTVEPLKDLGIPIYVRSTFNPDARGTLIRPPTPGGPSSRALRSVATKEKLAILKLYGPGMAYTPGIGERVFTALGKHKVNVYNMAASQASFALLIDEENVERGLKALEGVHEGAIQSVEGIKDMTLVCVVGRGIGSTHGTSGKIFTAIGRAGVNVEMISVGASDIALNFVVSSKDRDSCIRALHAEFLATSPAGDVVQTREAKE